MNQAKSTSWQLLYGIVAISIIGTGIGVLVPILVLIFLESVSWLNDVLLISPSKRIQVDNTLFLNIRTIAALAVGGLVVGCILRYLVSVQRALGPPDTILMVQTNASHYSLRSGIMSTIAATLSLGVGASVGQYGPLVYLGTIIGNSLSKFKIEIQNLQSICIASGVAAAIASAFNAPIAGLVFAHEVILRHYSIQAFAPTAVSAAVAYGIVTLVFQRPLLFSVHFEGIEYGYEFMLFGILGIFCAFIAITFSKCILVCTAYMRNSGIPLPIRPMLAGIILGIVAIKVPDVLGIGGVTLRFATIENAFEINELALIIAAKFAVTIVCISFGFAGGVFSPILLIGILSGALFGSVVDFFAPFELTSVVPYAICGMMASASPVIGAPLTTILIVFELTHSYDLAIAAMVSVVFSNLIAGRIFGRSLYEAQLFNLGFDMSLGRTSALTIYKKVAEIAHENYFCIAPRDKVGVVIERLEQTDYKLGLVVDDDEKFLGIVYLDMLRLLDPKVPVEVVAVDAPVTFRDHTSITDAVEAVSSFKFDIAPVICSKTKSLLGVVWHYDITDAYMSTAEKLRTEENETV